MRGTNLRKETAGDYIENLRSNIHGEPQWMPQDSSSIAERDGDRPSILMGIFERAKKINEKEFVEQQVQCTAVQYQQALKQARTEYTKYAKEISKWEGPMLDSIEGTCVFTPEQIKNRMDSVQQSMDILMEEIEKLQLKAAEAEETAAEIMEQHQRLLSWAEMFATASLEEKKMVASYVMRAVTLTRDCSIQ